MRDRSQDRESARSKASYFLDDDDEDFSILDGIGHHSDRKEQLSTSVRSPVPSSGKDDARGMSRVDHYRSLQGFVQALSEASPLYMGEKSRHPDMSENEIRYRVANACREHLDLVNECLRANNLESSDTMIRYQRRSLAKVIAQLYRHVSIDTVKDIIESARDWQLESKDFESTSSESISTDVILNAKMALFSSAMRARASLEGLWCDREAPDVMKELQKIALDLARQVAFSWSKRSQISDQESLFISALPHCLELTEAAYRDSVIELLPPLEYLPSDPAMRLPQLESEIKDMDAGYEGEHFDALLDRVRQLLRGFFNNRFFPEVEGLSRARLISAFVEQMDGQFAHAWEEATGSLMDKLAEMSEEEREEFASKNERMDVEPFFADIVERLENMESPLDIFEIDFDDVAIEARRSLAWVWGISDSLIAARKESLGDLHS